MSVLKERGRVEFHIETEGNVMTQTSYYTVGFKRKNRNQGI